MIGDSSANEHITDKMMETIKSPKNLWVWNKKRRNAIKQKIHVFLAFDRLTALTSEKNRGFLDVAAI